MLKVDFPMYIIMMYYYRLMKEETFPFKYKICWALFPSISLKRIEGIERVNKNQKWQSQFAGTIETKNKLEFIYKALQNNNTKIDLTW